MLTHRSQAAHVPARSRRKKAARPPVWRHPYVLIAVTAVVAVVAVFVGLSNASRNSGATAQPSTRDTRTLIDAVTKLEPQVVEAVGSGGLPLQFVPLQSATPWLAADGRPQILYVGADFCPYCAAQRWSLVMALSRFGSFDHLFLTQSSPSDVFPNTATFSFHGSGYSSDWLHFSGVETSDRAGVQLDTLSAEQQALYEKYDAPPYVSPAAKGGIPWLDLGNRYVMSSSGFSPQLLAGLSWAQIAEKLGDARDPVTQAIVGNANNLTAAICRTTGMQPAAVCTTAPVAEIAAQLP